MNIRSRCPHFGYVRATLGPLFTEPHFKASQHSEIGKTNADYLGDMLTEAVSWAYVRTMIKPRDYI